MRLLAVLLAAAALAPSASGAVQRNASLETTALAVRGTHVEVYCEDSQAAWDAVLPGASGVTDIPRGRVYLAPHVCAHIAETTGVNRMVAFYIFLHELIHTTGMTDEGQVDCWALFLLRYELRKQWHVTTAEAQDGYELAWTNHRAQDPRYQGACAPEPDAVSVLNAL